MVLLDLEKAYDTIWTRGLLRKLINYNFPAYLIAFLQSYLTGRTFTVVVDGASSSYRTQRAGLPQGAVLSPILFTLYISDIPRIPHIQYSTIHAVLARGYNRTQAQHSSEPAQKVFYPMAASGQYHQNGSHLLYQEKTAAPRKTQYRGARDTVVNGR